MLKRTPLYEFHKKLGAKMVEFGGWEMPVQYTGVIEEHNAVRTRAGLFDISHMGEIMVSGKDAKKFVNYVTTNNLDRIGDGRCQYSVCCYEDGGVVDDVITYQITPFKFLIVVNASNTDKDYDWFVAHKGDFDVSIENLSSEYYQLALQGPLAEGILTPLVSMPLYRLATFQFCETILRGKKIILSRTGYTGEDGFEIYGAWGDAPYVWQTLLETGKTYGLTPIGLGARDSLRLEAALSLYGHEIDKTINPFEARLSWVVKLDKEDFIGKEALTQIHKNGCQRKLVGLDMIDQGIPRQGYPVYAGDQKVGAVTSGTFSPTLQKPIGLALVEKTHATEGNTLQIEMRGQKRAAKVVGLPFYKKSFENS
ncbi:MAG TPA: glycine cleavage system aminomethyltransferase GcvT [Deltaproteobacteria bacterium]|nr:MAG: glycine cleavage system protein T [Deltaproteobacteria bacterium GWA2_45_12]HBF14005.1 glycine cleavage system aminomethyltransferase GcvT [Deltaproteobacteria bacterium]